MTQQSHNHLSLTELERALEGTLPGSRQAHLSSCAECSEAAEAAAILRRARPAPDPALMEEQAGCPPLDQLSLLVSGGLSVPESERLMGHIADCPRCSFLAAQAVEPSLRDSDAVRDADPEWLRQFGKRMAARGEADAEVPRVVAMPTTKPPTREAKGPSSGQGSSQWRLWAIAAAIVAVVSGGAIWNLSRTTPDQLLAQAYSEARPFAFRMNDDGYARVRQQRSAGTSALARPQALVEAEIAIREILQDSAQSSAEDAYGLWLAGKLELLEGQYDPAIESLTRASESEPGNGEILIDLGVAYAVRGTSEQRDLDLARAAEMLLRAQGIEADNPRIFFNLALVYEDMAMLEEARDAWQRFLELEPDGGWAEEARERMVELEAVVGRRDAIRARIQPDPAAFLEWVSSDADQIQVEWFHDIAWQDWLPAVDRDPLAAEALETLGRLFAEGHGDTSLQDALVAARVNPVGTDLLAQASRAISVGSYDEAKPFALQAEEALAHNPAAQYRARLEYAYAVQRAVFDECMAAAVPLAEDLGSTSYFWMLAQAQLEVSVCLARIGEEAEANRISRETIRLLESADFPILAMRAEAATTDRLALHGDAVGVWSRSLAGLRKAWEVTAPPQRTQFFVSTLNASAKSLGLRQLRAVLMKNAVRDMQLLNNPLFEAANRFEASLALEEAGFVEEAIDELERTEGMFDDLPQTPTVVGMRNRTRLHLLSLGEHPLPERIGQLEDLLASWEDTSPDERLLLHQALGLALMEAGRIEGAQESLEASLGVYLQQRSAVEGAAAEVASWELAKSSLQTLIALAVESGKTPEETLLLWDRYGPSGGLTVETHAELGEDTAAIIYFPLKETVAVWVVRRDEVTFQLLDPRGGELERTAGQLQRLCSQPGSSLAAIQQDGQSLYEGLLKPVEDQLTGADVLVVEATDWLAGIPFPVLRTGEDRYLIEDFAVALGSRLEQVTASPAEWDRGLILSAPSPGGEFSARFPFLPDASREANAAAQHFPQARFLQDDEATPEALKTALRDADVFHFAGHGWGNGGDGALVLPAQGAAEPVFLTSAELNDFEWEGLHLAVLSACMSGTGERWGPSNPYSLVRALLAGGTERVIAALWNADSGAAAELMNAFYAALESGESPAKALARADRALLDQPAFSHPYYWAPFASYGAA